MRTSLHELLVPPREPSDELLDALDAPAADVERSLRDLRRINLWFGGRTAWRRLVARCGGVSRESAILEIGTGTSDLLETMPRGALRVGVDIKIDHLLYGRTIGDPSIARVVADAVNLPFRDGSFELVGSSHFFHHFPPEENAVILDESLRVCRRATFVTDTRRNYVPLIFVQLLSVLGLVGRITRFDAPASVRQGYTVQEVRSFAERFRGHATSVRRMLPFRFALVIEKRSDG